jgi:hypothetical protein
MKVMLKKPVRAFMLLLAVAVFTVCFSGCLDTSTSDSEEMLSDEDFYILLGINMAIFFCFLAVFAWRAGQRSKYGNKIMDATLKPGGSPSKSPPDVIPGDSKLCSVCNTVNQSNQKFCIGCGFRL